MYCVRKFNYYKYKEKDEESNYPDWVRHYVRNGNLYKRGRALVINDGKVESSYVTDGDYLVLEGGILKAFPFYKFFSCFTILE